MRPRELVYGVVREPPSPFAPHQALVTRLGSAMHQHVQETGGGDVYVSPQVFDCAVSNASRKHGRPIVCRGTDTIQSRVFPAFRLVVESLGCTSK